MIEGNFEGFFAISITFTHSQASLNIRRISGVLEVHIIFLEKLANL